MNNVISLSAVRKQREASALDKPRLDRIERFQQLHAEVVCNMFKMEKLLLQEPQDDSTSFALEDIYSFLESFSSSWLPPTP